MRKARARNLMGSRVGEASHGPCVFDREVAIRSHSVRNPSSARCVLNTIPLEPVLAQRILCHFFCFLRFRDRAEGLSSRVIHSRTNPESPKSRTPRAFDAARNRTTATSTSVTSVRSNTTGLPSVGSSRLNCSKCSAWTRPLSFSTRVRPSRLRSDLKVIVGLLADPWFRAIVAPGATEVLTFAAPGRKRADAEHLLSSRNGR